MMLSESTMTDSALAVLQLASDCDARTTLSATSLQSMC